MATHVCLGTFAHGLAISTRDIVTFIGGSMHSKIEAVFGECKHKARHSSGG
jgi:hypothetical protein